MIFQQVYGFGTGPVTILGAPGEKVTYSGEASGSVTLNSGGSATLTMKGGFYNLSGSISAASGVTRNNIKVLPGSTVTMWPDNAKMVFWFCRYGTNAQGSSFTYAYSKDSGSDHIDFNNSNAPNGIRGGVVRYGNGDGDQMYMKLTIGPIDFSKYSTLHILSAFAGGRWGAGGKRAGYTTSTSYSVTMTSSQTDDGLHTFNISNVSGSYYVGVYANGMRYPSENNNAYNGFKAIWLT